MSTPQGRGLADPATIGPYTVRRPIGSGGMGRVYLAVDASGRAVAVKVIRTDLAADPQFRTRFRREIDAARRVPARCTARVLAADPDADRPWVACEYVDGPSLDRLVRERGPLRGRALRSLAVSLLRALVAMGRAGLVHRDLKPSNVLLGRGGPRVVDFGIARAADDTRLTSTGAMLGTPAYMAPEQALGDEQVGPPADVHSWGATLVFAATGESPYPGDAPAAVLYRKLHGEPRLGATPEPVRGWAGRCLARDPRDRPDAAELLAEARRPLRWTVGTAVVVLAVLAVTLGALYGLPPGGSGVGPTSPPNGAAAGSGVPQAPGLDPSVPGAGAPIATAPSRPATADGPVVALGHRAGRVVAGVGRVYVTDPDTGAVTVLDPLGRRIGRVDVGRFPSALALSPDGSRLYATLNTSPTRLVAVDTAALRITGTADVEPAGADPSIVVDADLAAVPDGRTVVVLDPRSARVVTVDATSLRTLQSRTVDRPIALDVTPDGQRVLVAGGDTDGTRLTALRLPSLAVVASSTVPGAPSPRDLAVDRDGSRAYLSLTGNSTLPDPVPDGVRVLEASDGRVRSVVAEPPFPERLVAGPGGRWLYALDSSVGGLRVLDTGTLRVVDRLDLPDQFSDAAVSPDGRALYIGTGSSLRIRTAPG